MPLFALRLKETLPDDLKTGAMPAAAANRSAEPKLPRSFTSARNSAVMTLPMPGRLMTIFPRASASTSSARRASRAAIGSLVLMTSEAYLGDELRLGASEAGSSWRWALAAATTRSASPFEPIDTAGFEPPGQTGFAKLASGDGPRHPAHGEEGTLFGQVQCGLQARKYPQEQLPESRVTRRVWSCTSSLR